MSDENDLIFPVQIKYVEVQTATLLRNEKIPPKIQQEPLQKATLIQNGLCQSPVSAESIDVTHGSPVTSPLTAGSPTNPLIPNKFQFDPNLTYAEKVAHEMLVTEKIYLDHLKQIIDGFLGPVVKDTDLDVSQENVDDLFINVEEIYQFNRVLLQDMEKCDFDPVKLAECFVSKRVGFDVYTKYCTHYPRSMEVLLEWNQREDTANFIKKQQESLGHTLPLCSFLLKPVQRVLKYHLLLGNIAKHFKQHEDEEGYEIIQKALSAMTNVAKHINDMKRKHEDDIHLQEIQSVLLDYEGPNLTSYGSIVLEDTFRIHGTKTGRYLLLFEKALLITKRRSDGTFSWKATVMYSNMMLADSVFREPLTFQVIPFDDRKICYTFVSRDLETKQIWLLELKRRLLDSYAAAVPMKAKQIILGNSKAEDCEKENAEPESVRKSTPSNNTSRGVNQQRMQTGKENGQSTKLSKSAESDRGRFKDENEALEEKTKISYDLIKSPLRRKLRVFKKRKFTSKDLVGKSSKRVSWSSDDNNEESQVNKQRLTINKQNEKEKKISDTEPCDAEEKKNANEKQFLDNNDNVVSISSLLHDGKTMVSVTGEEDSHFSGHVKLRDPQDDTLPSKKRRLTGEKRQKYKSMPAGEFPIVNESVPTITRTQSMSKLYEKFLEGEVIDTPTSTKELQKYGLVNLKEPTFRTKRLSSYDEELASAEGVIHRSSDVIDRDVTDDVADDVIGKSGQSVHHTMKRVSAAFSDISPNFSSEKSPTSSTEELTNEAEDLTAGDLTTEDFTPGDLTPEDFTPGDLSPATGSPIPEEVVTGEMALAGLSTTEMSIKPRCGDESKYAKENTDRHMGVEPEYSEYIKNKKWDQNDRDWNQTGTIESTYNEDIYDSQSQDDRHSAFHSEATSYADTLSDSFDEQDEEPWLLSFDGSYQRVFSLKRAYSEENLVSKFPFEEGKREDMSSKSCSHFDHEASACTRNFQHASITRSKSADCSRRPQSFTQPFTFSVTPKKKIVIKDSLWETIKENPEANNHEIRVANDVHALRRRRKRKSGQKKNRKNKSQSSDIQHLVRTYASLTMADYRPEKKNKNNNNKFINGSNNYNNSNNISGSSNSYTTNEAQSLKNRTKRNNFQNGIVTQKMEDSKKVSNIPDKTGDSSNSPSVTKLTVALRKKSPRQKSLVRVDNNESEVPPTINYVCVETVPSEECLSSEDRLSTNEQAKTTTCDVKRTNGNTSSTVERLSKYFNKATTENETGKPNKQTEAPQKSRSIKMRVEELSRRESDLQKTKRSEDKLIVKEELISLQNIQDRIGVLQRSNSDENQTKSRIELTSALNHGIPNVKQLKSKLESTTEAGQKETVKNETSHSKKSTSLRVKDRIEELQQHPPASESTPKARSDTNVDEDLRTIKRLKERIARLQKDAKRDSMDSERDITISDDVNNESSPRQNEDLRTVVIKRGWVQQFVQKIETRS